MQKAGFIPGTALQHTEVKVKTAICIPERIVWVVLQLIRPDGRSFTNILFFAGGMMGKPWVQLRLFVGVLVLLLPLSSVSAKDVSEKLLTDDELKNPEFAVNWLKTKSGTADKKRAMWFYEFGLKSKHKGSWSPAGKAFGESMIRYPSPHALAEYANAVLYVYGGIVRQTKTVNLHKKERLDIG